jgi:hypothetical protein
MQHKSTFFILLGCLVVLGMMIWTKPACRDDYLASMFFDGWACVPGYKPQR